MATFIRKFRYQTVLSSLLQQNRLPATIVTYRFSSSSIIKYKSYATEVGRSDSEDIHPRFSDTADNNNKTSMNTNNADEATDILLAPVDPNDVECKPDGIIYLPEIKYRRILNKAFGPGGWGLAPRGDNSVSPRIISREYALVCHGRLVSIARGECEYFDPSGLATAAEGAKSNALMRCCKDLGYCEDVFVEHVVTTKRRKHWKRKDAPVDYPFKIVN
ncbi:19348_t:CDS:2 [Entrophospora sp. SA101]|nr:19348_t:CDS:2 [Entrophospora sp. SA101]